jgi:anthranilate/para-aminobenzoate synthase component II
MDLIRQLGETTDSRRLPGPSGDWRGVRRSVVRARVPMHGKTSTIEHDGRGVFTGSPGRSSPRATIRWSWRRRAAGRARGDGADAEDDQIMGLRHREWPVHGVQFHPSRF